MSRKLSRCVRKRVVHSNMGYLVLCRHRQIFDRINHNYLLDKIGMKGKYRKQIKYWLKSGVLDNETFAETELGTPQRGVISPLLANIALHGMERKTSARILLKISRY